MKNLTWRSIKVVLGLENGEKAETLPWKAFYKYSSTYRKVVSHKVEIVKDKFVGNDIKKNMNARFVANLLGCKSTSRDRFSSTCQWSL